MFLKRNAIALACCVILHFSSVKAETSNGKSTSKEDLEENDDSLLNDDHTFVALIDIVFTDGSKRTCTGAIIHDYVVITAAHCFHYSESVKPELSASFVVIGTKKMFDTGYEQYLPIERILTHPKFRGWTADLSLIYTFAAMTSDKPGRVIPLAGEKMSNPVDSNVTVLSWGHCKKENNAKHAAHNWHISMTTKKPCPEDSYDEFRSQEQVRVTAGLNSKRSHGQVQTKGHPNIPVQRFKKNLRPQSRFQKESRLETDLLQNYPGLQRKVWEKQIEERPVEVKRKPTIKRISRYLTSNEDNESEQQDERPVSRNTTYMPHVTLMNVADELPRGRIEVLPSPEPVKNIKAIYKNWRRHMGNQQNKLTVEVFGFVNMAACRKIVEASDVQPHFEFKNGEVACYTSYEHYVTQEDSGAPAIRHGQLVAVTVGGAQCDGDHVGVGMMMSCYCTWIADNLPGGGANINCCKNCCDSKYNEDSSRNTFRNRNKYLARYID